MIIKEYLYDSHDEFGSYYSKSHTTYGEFMYCANSWDIERRVCFKIQRKAGELLPNCVFIATSMDADPKDVMKFYSKRGSMGNFIKKKQSFISVWIH